VILVTKLPSPQITILTPSYNQAVFIEQTIRSVIDQNYPNVQHIVIDGGSTDETVEILRKYPHLLWISEKDGGQADALRKGLQRATGDVIGWLNSDDLYESQIFKQVARCFQDTATQWAIGDLSYLFDATGETIPDKSPRVTYRALLENPDIVRQQPTFFRRSFLEQVGGWRPEYFMVMDFDLWVRSAKVVPPVMVDANWAYFRYHAAQKTSLSNIRKQAGELERILKREGASSWALTSFMLRRRWLLSKGHVKEWLLNHGLLSSRYRTRPLRVGSGA
jgi:glycosyltransferase involved in cell wall biosynthesis